MAKFVYGPGQDYYAPRLIRVDAPTDNLATITAPGYLTSSDYPIEVTDVIFAVYSGGQGYFAPTISVGVITLNPISDSNNSFTGDLTINSGNLILNTQGKVYEQKSGGANATCGSGVVLSAGAATINTTAVQAGDIIYLIRQRSAGTPGILDYTITAGSHFVVNSASSLDTSTIAWQIWRYL